MKVLMLIVWCHGWFAHCDTIHKYFSDYAECYAYEDQWRKDNSGGISISCIHNPDYER